MLQITEETRDKIAGFLGTINVPVNAATSFLQIIEVLKNLEKIKENEPCPPQ